MLAKIFCAVLYSLMAILVAGVLVLFVTAIVMFLPPVILLGAVFYGIYSLSEIINDKFN